LMQREHQSFNNKSSMGYRLSGLESNPWGGAI
jgi:hypothetical protein